jgi:hypothetical protein
MQKISDQNREDIEFSKNSLTTAQKFMIDLDKEAKKRNMLNMTDVGVNTTPIGLRNEAVQTEYLVNNQLNTIATMTTVSPPNPAVDQNIITSSAPIKAPEPITPPSISDTVKVVPSNTPVYASPAIQQDTKSNIIQKQPEPAPMVNQAVVVNMLPITSNNPNDLLNSVIAITKRDSADKKGKQEDLNKEKKRAAFIDNARKVDSDLFENQSLDLNALINEKTPKQKQLELYNKLRSNELKPLLDVLKKINDNPTFSTSDNYALDTKSIDDLKILTREGNSIVGVVPFKNSSKIGALAYVIQNQSEYSLYLDVLNKIENKLKHNSTQIYTGILTEAYNTITIGGANMDVTSGGYLSYKRNDALSTDPFNDTYRYNIDLKRNANVAVNELLLKAVDHLVYVINTTSGETSANISTFDGKLDMLNNSLKRDIKIYNNKLTLFMASLSNNSLTDAYATYEVITQMTDILSAYYYNSIAYLDASIFSQVASTKEMTRIKEVLNQIKKPLYRGTVVIKKYQKVLDDSESRPNLFGPEEEETPEKRNDPDEQETFLINTQKKDDEATTKKVKLPPENVVTSSSSGSQSRARSRSRHNKANTRDSTSVVEKSQIDKKIENEKKKQVDDLADLAKKTGQGIHDIVHNHLKRIKKYDKIKNAPHLEYPKTYMMDRMIDEHLGDYDKNTTEPKDVLCGHCGKGISSPNKDDENNKMHLSNTDEIMHKKCFEQKGGTPKRVLYKKAKGYDIELNSPDPKAKQLAEQQERYRSHKDMENVEFPTLWDDFLESSKSFIKNPNNLIEAAHTRDIFLGKFSERRFNEMVFLIGYHNNHLEEDDEMINHNLEIATAKYLMNKKYKSTNRTHLPVSNFEKLKKTLIAEPGILRNLDF